MTVDAVTGQLALGVPADEFAARAATGGAPSEAEWVGTGRELFAALRAGVGAAELGAGTLGSPLDHVAGPAAGGVR